MPSVDGVFEVADPDDPVPFRAQAKCLLCGVRVHLEDRVLHEAWHARRGETVADIGG